MQYNEFKFSAQNLSRALYFTGRDETYNSGDPQDFVRVPLSWLPSGCLLCENARSPSRQHRPPGCSPCLESVPGSCALASCCLWADLSFSVRPTLTTLLHITGPHPTSSSSLSWLKLSFSSFRSIYQHLTCHKIYFSCLLSHRPQTAGNFHELRDFSLFFLVTDLFTVLRTVLDTLFSMFQKNYEVIELNALLVLCFCSLKKDFLRV